MNPFGLDYFEWKWVEELAGIIINMLLVVGVWYIGFKIHEQTKYFKSDDETEIGGNMGE